MSVDVNHMEKRRTYLIALLATAAVGAAIFFASSFTSTSVLVHNMDVSAVEVRIETDIGESYIVGQLKPDSSKRIAISGRDKALWLAVAKADGSRFQSTQIYSTSGASITGVIDSSEVVLSYSS